MLHVQRGHTPRATHSHARRSEEAGPRAEGPEQALLDAARLIDPEGLVDDFRNGRIDPRRLEGTSGQILLQQIKEKANLVQALFDAVRGIQDVWIQALRRIAENIGR